MPAPTITELLTQKGKLKKTENLAEIAKKEASALKAIKKEIRRKKKQENIDFSEQHTITVEQKEFDINSLFDEFKEQAEDGQIYSLTWEIDDVSRTSQVVIDLSEHSIRYYKNKFANLFRYATIYDVPDGNNFVNFYFNPLNLPNPGIPISRESASLNCFLKIIKPYLSKEKLLKKQEQYKEGILYLDILKECKKLKISVSIYDQLGYLWGQSETKGNYKNIDIVHANNHVEKVADFNIFKVVKKQEILTPTEITELLKKPSKFPLSILGEIRKSINAVFINDTVYKNKENILLPEESAENIELFTFSVIGRGFRQIVDKYNLRKTEDDLLGKFITIADKPAIWYNLDYKKTPKSIYSFDQTRAFSKYKLSPYYKKYQFPLYPSHLYTVIDNNTTRILDLTGFSQVNNVKIFSPFLQKIKYLQNYSVYTNLRLKYLLDNKLASFTIIATAFNPKNQDIDFNITEIDDVAIPIDDLKRVQNSILGRLIPNGKTTKTVLTNNIDEYNHLRSNILANKGIIKFSDFDKELQKYFITYHPKETEVKNKYSHLHAYIMDYQQTRLIPFIIGNEKSELTEKNKRIQSDNILEVRTDAVILRKVYTKPNKIGGFKKPTEIVEKSDKIFTYVHHIMNNLELYPFPNFYKGFDFIKHNRFYIEGIAGTGKTTTLTKYNKFYKSILLQPTNDLVAESSFNSQTYHKFFGVNQEENTQKRIIFNNTNKYKNIILDECSMIDKKTFKFILSVIPDDINLYCISGLKQLKPVRGLSIRPNTLKKGWLKITLTQIYRTTNLDYINRQKLLIEQTTASAKLKLFMDRKIENNKLEELFKIEELDYILANTNEIKDEYNKRMLRKYPNRFIVKYKYTSANTIKNKRIIINKEDFNDKIHEIAFATTTHSVQGKSIKQNIFIDYQKIFELELLNVSLSRNEKIENLYLLQPLES